MAAGQIKAPIIIPLKPPQLSKTKSLTTEIKIDLISESPDTDIYFTVNGFKPEPFKFSGDKQTFKFTVPFCLPAGKRTVKAIAVSRDGSRESNIVTKVFDIEQVDVLSPQKKTQEDTYGFLEELREQKKVLSDAIIHSYKKNDYDAANPNLRSIVPQYLSMRSSSSKKHGKMSDYLAGLNLESNSDRTDTLIKSHKKKIENDEKVVSKIVPDVSYQSLRLQRETDFLKCIYCLAARPTDPLAKFCNNCGQAIPPLPVSRLPPPETGQLGMCVLCRSTVPMNLPNCLVCEAPLNVQNQPQATNKLRERVLCTICGTTNPPNMDSCLTCEAQLPEIGKAVKMYQPNQPPTPSTFANISSSDIPSITCLKCSRQNHFDSRFCDWCGYKSDMGSNYLLSHVGRVVCSKCGANNSVSATYCCQCGNTVIAPPRQAGPILNGTSSSPWNTITIPLPTNNGILKPDSLNSQKTSFYMTKNSQCDVSTQTVGLFYPSTAQLKKNEEKQKPALPNNAWEKPTPLSLVSPGKGFWRKQIDHIICHLKAHASNFPEFQAMIGEPRMGKLITADVQEDEVELNLTLTFALKGYKDPYQREISEEFDKRYLSSMLKRTGSFDSFRSDDTLQSTELSKQRKTPTTSSRCRSAKKKPYKQKPSRIIPKFALSELDRNLLKEIGKSGKGRPEEIEHLFDEGADPKCKNGRGVPFISIAVRNKHKDAIRMLYKLGANLNEIEPEFGNTPLHEAVLLGPSDVDIINELLSCGASSKIKNKNGESPNDLALKVNNDAAVKHFSSQIGKNQIEKLIQPKQIGDSDDEKI